MKYLHLILLLVIIQSVYSQENTTINLSWEKNLSYNNQQSLYFEGALYNDFSSPIYNKKIKIKNPNIKVELSQLVFESLTKEEEKWIDKNSISSKIDYSSKVYKDRGELFLSLVINPFIKSNNSNSYQKLSSFKINYIEDNEASRNYNLNRTPNATNSELAEGDWLKMGITKHGVYKITYEDIVNSGIKQINNPRIFGYGGKVLPEYNGESMPDDMNELAISIEKGSDGIFNSGDYLLFYAEGPTTWNWDDTEDIFLHETHLYTDTIFYFLSCNTGNSMLVENTGNNLSPSETIDVFMDKQVHENDRINILKSGKTWLGEEYNAIHESHTFNFSFPNMILDSLVSLQTFVAARCGEYSYINTFYNGQEVQSVKVPNVNLSSYTSYYMREGTDFDKFKANSPSISLVTKYDQYSQYNAWMNFIRVSAVRQLELTSNQLVFSNIYNLGETNKFIVTNANSNYSVFDVTNLNQVKEISTNALNTHIEFNDVSDGIKTYCIFNKTSAPKPSSIKKINNQNLHKLENIEYVILTPSQFRSQAEQIADFHRSSSQLTTVVVSNEEVYNEFSSGTPDITAIKNFMRHLYKFRSNTDTLKYLLLFGDGSYDNKSSSSNTNKILTFQSKGSIKVSGTYVSDDYFGLLDDTEGSTSGYLDIGIGRLVINTQEEADNAVRKITNYNSSSASYGNWRSKINFVADNGDGNLHVNDADDIATMVETNYPSFNINKIYMDAYPLVESAGGDIVPEATHEFNTAINQGTLILNYTGHGGELGLAHEQLVSVQNINSWENSDKLAAFITATCEFTRYDDKERTSAGEYVFLNPNGGGIALFTTTRIAYAGPNKVINTAFYNQFYNDNTFRMGDMIRRTKNAIGSTSQNMRIFTLIGDPALSLAVPKQKIRTTIINEQVANEIDTINISPLTKVTIEGEVINNNNIILSDFNGVIYPTVYDKPDTLITLCQHECSYPVPFMSRKSIIYKGKASVKDGKFSYSFIVPKDISYKNGLGKISYYADNKDIDAFGHTDKISISGNSNTSITDNQGPQIELYMNDENFIHGGTTDENPVLIATLYDENGINTVGNGIGHDLSAQLDESNQLAILNSYYEADMDSYQSGKVSYPYAELEEGKHQIKLKAWDVFNNSSEASIEFFVAESTDLVIKHLFNYPNPFTTSTDFYFDHNHSNQNLDVIIQIFTITGKLVKTIETHMLTDGFRSTPIHWDGKDDYNDQIARGVYIYKVKVRSETGQTATEFEKLVLLK